MASPPLLLLLLLLSFLPSGTPDLTSDKVALLALRASVGNSVLQWNATTSPYSWRGVYCSGHRVTALRLPAVGLLGAIPAGTIGNLTALRVLSLRLNALSGSLPPDISNLQYLRSLYLQGNQFSGELPDEFFSLLSLSELDLSENNFSGGISPQFNNLIRLRLLFLQNNQLSGELPNINLPDIIEFNVSYNKLKGSVPQGLRSMPAASFLGMPLCGGPMPPCNSESPPPSSGPRRCGDKKSSKFRGGAIAGIVVVSAGGILILAGLLKPPGRSSCAPMEPMPPESSSVPVVATGTGTKPPGWSSCAPMEPMAPESSSVPVAATGTKPPEWSSSMAARPKPPEGASSTLEVAKIPLSPVPELPEESSSAAAKRKPPERSSLAAAKPKPPEGSSSGAAEPKPPKESSPKRRNGEKGLVFYGERAEEFDAADLSNASTELLGAGTHGTTYKTVLENGMTMVVKRLMNVKVEEREFEERIQAISSLRHENLVRLRACSGRLLFYDYFPRGSLSTLMRGPDGATVDWSKRYSIALAAARGIKYIHSRGTESSHGDIKSSNILLCSSNHARVSDYGLHQLSGRDSPKYVNAYRAPEVTDLGRVSQMADVYSFGVVLFGLVTGEVPLEENDPGMPRLMMSMSPEWRLRQLDPELTKQQDVREHTVQVMKLAMDCTVLHPCNRPSMSDVVARLEQIMRSGNQHRTLLEIEYAGFIF